MTQRLEIPFSFVGISDFFVDDFGEYHFRMHQLFPAGLDFYLFCMNPSISGDQGFRRYDIRSLAIQEYNLTKGGFNDSQRDFSYNLFGRDFDHSLESAEVCMSDAESIFQRYLLKRKFSSSRLKERYGLSVLDKDIKLNVTKDDLYQIGAYFVSRAGGNLSFVEKIMNDNNLGGSPLNFSPQKARLMKNRKKIWQYGEFNEKYKKLNRLYEKLEGAWALGDDAEEYQIREKIEKLYNQ